MANYYKILLAVFFSLVLWDVALAQNESDERPLLEVEDGISISRDSLFLLNLRFRMQNRFGMHSLAGNDLSIHEIDARVRRLRLRFDGFVLNEKLLYYIQLSFSRADQDLDRGEIAHPIRDAVLYYNVNNDFYFGLGQAKLPGNRQRVVSSGNMQFAERSIVNAAMTLDRDFGLFAYFNRNSPFGWWHLKTALTTGEGRNAPPGNKGMAYTARVEYLPLGKFKNGGDYSEGDLEREERPKLSLAAGYSYNARATRTGGQLGPDLYSERNISTFIADMVFKFRGFALSSEYMQRSADDPITLSSDSASLAYVYVGNGLNTQMSYFFSSGYEFAMRYSMLNPRVDLQGQERQMEELWLGVSKYLNGHRIKLQWHAAYRWRESMQLSNPGNFWSCMMQVEFGI
jgi:phosphate-selective porin OprO and OprP